MKLGWPILRNLPPALAALLFALGLLKALGGGIAAPSRPMDEAAAAMARRVDGALLALSANKTGSAVSRAVEKTVAFTQDELNAALRDWIENKQNSTEPVVFKSARVRLEAGNLVAVDAVLRLGGGAGKALGAGAASPLKRWAGLLSVENSAAAECELRAADGKGAILVKRAAINGVPLPAPLVESILRLVGRQQRPPQDFSRSIILPDGIESAKFAPGRLELRVRTVSGPLLSWSSTPAASAAPASDEPAAPARSALWVYLFILASAAVAFILLREARSAFAAVLAAALVLAVFWAGVSRGLDHASTTGPEDEQNAIAIALSDVVYGLNDGYIGYGSVHSRLLEVWNTGASGLREPELARNDHDADRLNAAISSASKLWPDQRGRSLSNGGIVTALYQDLGYTDLVETGFRLFGLRFEAMYWTFFLILGASAAAFLLAFKDDLAAQAALLAGLLCFSLELRSGIFSDGMPTFSCIRHGSALGLTPALHFAFLLARRRRPTATGVLLALLQAAVLVFAMKIRGSAAWMLLYLVSLSAGLALWERRADLAALSRQWPSLVKRAAAWPVLALLAVMVAHAQYMKSALNIAYFTDEITPGHSLWHSAYLGVYEFLPGLIEAQGIDMHRTPDGVGFAAAADYLIRHHVIASESEATSHWTNQWRMGLDDKVMRRVFMELASSHKLAMAELYLARKPWAIAAMIGSYLAAVPLGVWLLVLLGAFAHAGLCVKLFGLAAGDAVLPSAVLLGALPFAALPNLWAYPVPHTISDLLLCALAACTAIMWTASGLFWLRLRRADFWLRRKSQTAPGSKNGVLNRAWAAFWAQT